MVCAEALAFTSRLLQVKMYRSAVRHRIAGNQATVRDATAAPEVSGQ